MQIVLSPQEEQPYPYFNGTHSPPSQPLPNPTFSIWGCVFLYIFKKFIIKIKKNI
jgi:hypothetical protein